MAPVNGLGIIRIRWVWPLLLAMAGSLIGSLMGEEFPKVIFPSDGEGPLRGGVELLQVVCPGRVVSGKGIMCHAPCPNYTDSPLDDTADAEWTLAEVIRGHFLSPSSEDVVLAMTGCEPHSENFGGAILLTRRSQHWAMLWYKAGVETSHCHKVPLLDGRDILVCVGSSGARGSVSTELYVEDLLKPSPSLMAGNGGFFSVEDDTRTCGWNSENERKPFPLTRAYIERVSFGPGARKGLPVISVTAAFGKRLIPFQEAQACIDEHNPNKAHLGMSLAPSTRSYRVEFFFDGRNYRPSPSSAKTVQMFAGR